MLLGAGIMALIVMAGGAWYFHGANRPAVIATNAPTPAAAHLSIVVLPFTNLSGDPSQDYFADSITEDLTTDLSRSRNSFVIARNTAVTYKGKNIDAKEIGKELGVRYVLEGSVRRDQDRVRVNAQLIDADSGAHLWADQFDTARADLLQMQDEIVARLANTLGIELVKAETQRNVLSTNPDAMDLAMRCTTAVRKAGYFGKEAEAGYRLCERALDADPNNVLALVILSVKFYLPVMLFRSADPQADLKRADELASRALALSANSPSAHFVKGQVLLAERRVDDAIAEYERSLALDPNNANAVAALGITYSALGQYEKAIGFTDKAIRLSPHDPDLSFWCWTKSGAYFALQQYDQAMEWARRSIAINSNFSPPHSILAAALALTGHEAEARDALERSTALRKPKSIAALKAAMAPWTSADPRLRAMLDRLFEGLRKAGMPEE
jgi:adenylate cyclase